jgi:hypothetical protein
MRTSQELKIINDELGVVGTRLNGLDNRLSRVEESMTWIKWFMGVNLAAIVAVLWKAFGG